eukprot:TRINITY_DN25880_c0_g5_i1.p1 TRINITY_DN25880_c0_g5~~TRINITY_DN25880_c0_g5_i1.p1  ORF type:complete len:628 (+),score=77.24 TRINITY_DN25880_c0_g5_i1:55-1884(+)
MEMRLRRWSMMPCVLAASCVLLFLRSFGHASETESTLERLLVGVVAEHPATAPLLLKARRNGVNEAIEVHVPLPSHSEAWMTTALAAVRDALVAAPPPPEPTHKGDALLPKSAQLYTGDGIGPLSNEHVSRLRNGSVVVLVDEQRPFVWPFVLNGPRFTSPRAPLVGGKPIELEPINAQPRVFRAHNLLTEEECDELVKGVAHLQDGHGLERSTTGGKRSSGGMHVNRVRTSENAFDVDSKMALRLMHRSFGVLGMDFDYRLADGLQIVRYLPGQAYKEHLDAFAAGTSKEGFDFDSSKAGANRLATVFMYCSSPAEGGQTVFPLAKGHSEAAFTPTWDDRKSELSLLAEKSNMSQDWEFKMVETCHSKLAVRPKKGDGVIFYSQNVDGTLDSFSQHGGCPVLEGVKWSANLWVWNRPRDGTQTYYINSKDAIIRNDFPHGRVTLMRNAKLAGTLEPGEEAHFHMHLGQTWSAVVEETNVPLTGWSVTSTAQKLYTIPAKPDKNAKSFVGKKPPRDRQPKEEKQPALNFVNDVSSSCWIFWVHPQSGAESLVTSVGVGEERSINTFHGHQFNVRDTDKPGKGKLLGRYQVPHRALPPSVRISELTASEL